MRRYLLNLVSWGAIATLLIFTARRWLFIVFALKPIKSRPHTQATPPDVILLVPIRNEALALPALLKALDRLDYPAERLTTVLIDDGSTDDSPAVIQGWVTGKNNRHSLRLAQNAGKAQALNIALERFSQGDIVAIYDADERPAPDALSRLVRPFSDRRVGGVSGRRAVSNALATSAASYTAFEGLVHQLVTLRAKDRLGLAPPILGANCAYRRSALLGLAGFKPGALLEDSDLSVKLVRAGWLVRFVPEAVSYHQVPQTLAGYWRQHTRWARGFNEVAKDQATSILTDARLPLRLRLELLIFSLGYFDRVALIVGLMGYCFNRKRRRLLGQIILISLLTPLLQIIAALKISRQPRSMWRRTVWVPLFFGLDVAMATTGLWTTLLNLPQVWEERRARK